MVGLSDPDNLVPLEYFRGPVLEHECHTLLAAADLGFVLCLIDAGLESLYIPKSLARFRIDGVGARLETVNCKETIRARVTHGPIPVFEPSRYCKRRLLGWLHQRFPNTKPAQRM